MSAPGAWRCGWPRTRTASRSRPWTSPTSGAPPCGPSGRVGAAGGRIDATVDARRVEPLADLLRKFVPGRLPALVAARAPTLIPLRLRLTAEKAAVDAPARITAEGTAAASRLTGTAHAGRGAGRRQRRGIAADRGPGQRGLPRAAWPRLAAAAGLRTGPRRGRALRPLRAGRHGEGDRFGGRREPHGRRADRCRGR